VRGDFDVGTVLAGLFVGIVAFAFGYMASFDVRKLPADVSFSDLTRWDSSAVRAESTGLTWSV
jgi:hypothetical protein